MAQTRTPASYTKLANKTVFFLVIIGTVQSTFRVRIHGGLTKSGAAVLHGCKVLLMISLSHSCMGAWVNVNWVCFVPIQMHHLDWYEKIHF